MEYNYLDILFLMKHPFSPTLLLTQKSASYLSYPFYE